jgi:hypothetical protein
LFNDHKEAKTDHAAAAIRIDSPVVKGLAFKGKWKLFFDASLLRAGKASPYELYNLADDQWEKENLIDKKELRPLVDFMTAEALLHRNAGGHRIAEFAPMERTVFDWRSNVNSTINLTTQFAAKTASSVVVKVPGSDLEMTVSAARNNKPLTDAKFNADANGLGISGGDSTRIDSNEALVIRFNRDVIVESAAVAAGKDGACGGFYRVGEASPLAIYCVDADIDAQDQSGILSDIGVLKAGETLRLDSSPHLGVEAAGAWRLESLKVRELD